MTDTEQKSEDVSGPFKQTPLTISEHMDADKHWIGETLPAPTQTEIAGTVGTVAGPGDSPFPARADHLHKLDPGFFPTWSYLVSGTTFSATTSTSFITWLITSTFTVPTWATKAIIQVNLTGIYSVTATSAYALDATISTASYSGDYAVFSTGDTQRNSISFSKQSSGFAVGTQDVRIGARRASGTGVLTHDASSKTTCIIFWGA